MRKSPEFRRPQPNLPCHKTWCSTCGHSIALELVNGKVTEYCAGCAMNAERARLGLPAVSYVTQHAPEPPKVNRVRPVSTKRTKVRSEFRAIVLRKLPTYEFTAASTSDIAASCGVSRQKILDCLYELRDDGIAALIEPSESFKRGLLWYRINMQGRV